MVAIVYKPVLRFKKGSKDMAGKTTGSLVKTHAENLQLQCLFVDSITGLPLTITGASVVITDSTGMDVGFMIDGYTVSEDEAGLVLVNVQYGDNKQKYLLRVLAQTDQSALMELSVAIKIQDARV